MHVLALLRCTLSSFWLLALLLPPQGVVGQDLFEALVDAGASQFAEAILNNPEALAAYTSGKIRTVFAAKDVYDGNYTKRESLDSDEEDAAQQLKESGSETELEIPVEARRYRSKRGYDDDTVAPVIPFDDIESVDDKTNLKELNTTLVIEFQEVCRYRKRYQSWDSHGDGDNYDGAASFRVVSGFGDYVEILEANIPFDNGLIHIVEEYMTIPLLLSETAEKKGWTEFLDLLCSTGQKDALDTIPLTTFFVPSNEALEAANIDKSEEATVLAEHVVPDFLGLTTRLEDGLCLINQNGNVLRITVVNGEFFVNDAKIIETNVLVDNGVAHLIDKVLTPTETPSHTPTHQPPASTTTKTTSTYKPPPTHEPPTTTPGPEYTHETTYSPVPVETCTDEGGDGGHGGHGGHEGNGGGHDNW